MCFSQATLRHSTAVPASLSVAGGTSFPSMLRTKQVVAPATSACTKTSLGPTCLRKMSSAWAASRPASTRLFSEEMNHRNCSNHQVGRTVRMDCFISYLCMSCCALLSACLTACSAWAMVVDAFARVCFRWEWRLVMLARTDLSRSSGTTSMGMLPSASSLSSSERQLRSKPISLRDGSNEWTRWAIGFPNLCWRLTSRQSSRRSGCAATMVLNVCSARSTSSKLHSTSSANRLDVFCCAPNCSILRLWSALTFSTFE
mmetsp:Transcript_98267/g.278270  ORF Transcript_98267/g.278270 Transcript_98267/m.278270 type:complete len:258 (-) Transcript_98267:1325-2098(-)